MLHRIELNNQETDIDVVLPGGKLIQLQYRLEGPSIDICLPAECVVTNWEGDDMKPAQTATWGCPRPSPHVLSAKQLVIDLNPDW